MCKRITCFGLMAFLMFSGMTTAQPASSGAVRDLHGEWTLWQLANENWYFRLTVGALANIRPEPFQATGFARLHLGLRWNPDWLLTPQIQMTRATHEIGIGLENIGDKPRWVLEITPLIIDFEINPRINRSLNVPSTAPAEQPMAQPDQQVSLDLKALVLARLDDLLKASEQIAKDTPNFDPATFRDPLNEFKKAFEAGKMTDATLQLNLFSVLLRVMRKAESLKEFDELHLRTGLYRLLVTLALFTERVQRQTTKICTASYLREDQKAEEVISPFANEAVKRLSFTNKQTGAKEAFTLKESKCF